MGSISHHQPRGRTHTYTHTHAYRHSWTEAILRNQVSSGHRPVYTWFKMVWPSKTNLFLQFYCKLLIQLLSGLKDLFLHPLESKKMAQSENERLCTFENGKNHLEQQHCFSSTKHSSSTKFQVTNKHKLFYAQLKVGILLRQCDKMVLSCTKLVLQCVETVNACEFFTRSRARKFY